MLVASFSELYGDYSGTRVLHANGVIADVIAFFEGAQYGLMPETVVAQSRLFPEETAWFGQGTGALYWKDSDTVRRVKNGERIEGRFYLISCTEDTVDSNSIAEVTRILEQGGWKVEEVFLGKDAVCSIVVCGPARLDSPWIQGWTTISFNGNPVS